jgi:hypothetical protein
MLQRERKVRVFALLLTLGASAGLGCEPSTARADKATLRTLHTGFECERTAPLGREGRGIASTQVAWDSLWSQVYALPGRPPAVDFSREIALLQVTSYGGGLSGYASEFSGARISSQRDTLYMRYRIRDVGPAVDTSSRKAIAAAVSFHGAAAFAVAWEHMPVRAFSSFAACAAKGAR